MAWQHFRVTIVARAGSSYVAISGVRVLANESDIAAGQPASASSEYNGVHLAGNVTDGNAATTWRTATGNADAYRATVQIDLTSNAEATIDSYAIECAPAGEVDHRPEAWFVEITEDPAGLFGWRLVDARRADLSDQVFHSFAGPYPDPLSSVWKAIRFRATSSETPDIVGLAELQVTAGAENVAELRGVAASSAFDWTFPETNINDNSTGIGSIWNSNAAMPQFAAVFLDPAINTIDQVSLIFPQLSPGSYPTAWTIEGITDPASDNWIALATDSGSVPQDLTPVIYSGPFSAPAGALTVDDPGRAFPFRHLPGVIPALGYDDPGRLLAAFHAPGSVAYGIALTDPGRALVVGHSPGSLSIPVTLEDPGRAPVFRALPGFPFARLSAEAVVTVGYRASIESIANPSDRIYLSISSFQSRRYDGDPTWIGIVVPNILGILDQIQARQIGIIRVFQIERDQHGAEIQNEIAAAEIESFDPYMGAESTSANISGHKTEETTAPKVWALSGVSYLSTVGGVRQIRSRPDALIRPGDRATWNNGAESMIVGKVSFAIASASGLMHITERSE